MPLLLRGQSLPLLLLPPLPLRAVVKQERQGPTKRKNDQGLEDVGVDVVAVVAVAAVEVVLVVVGLVVVPAGELGFEEGAEPFGEGEVFLDGCRRGLVYTVGVGKWGPGLTGLVLDGLDLAVCDGVPPAAEAELVERQEDGEMRFARVGLEREVVVALCEVEVLVHADAVLVHPA